MQPRSGCRRAFGGRHRKSLLLLVIITAATWLRFCWKATQSSEHEKEKLDLTTVNDQIPYPEVQKEPPVDNDGHTRPPLYQRYREYEDRLSEVYLTSHTGDERYISFDNHVWGSGWGNVLQEMVFNSLLAWESKRSYVWDDYTWNQNGSEYGEFNGKIVPAHIPLSTMIAGHFLGFNEKDHSLDTYPRPISRRIYDKVCPRSRRKSIQQNHVQAYFDHQYPDTNAKIDQLSGKQTLNVWVSYLDTPEIRNTKCLVVQHDTPQIFNIWLLGGPRMHSLWGPLIQSPILTDWQWSPLIYRAFIKNMRWLIGKSVTKDDTSASYFDILKGIFPRPFSLSPAIPSSKSEDMHRNSSTIIHGVLDVPKEILDPNTRLPILALHLRRGDFQTHCSHFAKYSSTYTGFNSYPDLAKLDHFYVPRVLNETKVDEARYSIPRRPNTVIVGTEGEKQDIYMQHCFPEIQQIVQRVREVVHDFEMELRRQMYEETGNQPWWSWGLKLKKEERRRHNPRSPSSQGSSISASKPTYSASNIIPKTVIYPSNAKGSTAPRFISTPIKRSRPAPQASLANQLIRKVYIMSNGEKRWLQDVARALKADAERSKTGLGSIEHGQWEFNFEWDDVRTSRDLDLGWEEKPVSQALDMYIAQRAEVFVGNGFSSMSSNVVMLRLKAGLKDVRTRFW